MLLASARRCIQGAWQHVPGATRRHFPSVLFETGPSTIGIGLAGQFAQQTCGFAGFRRRARVGAKHQLTRYVANQEIRVPTVQLVDEAKKLVGDPIDSQLARMTAKEQGLDLILLDRNAKPYPICIYGDLKKIQFEDRKRAQAKRVEDMDKRKETKVFKFKSNIDEGDIQRNIDWIAGFIQKGHRVECQIWLLRRRNIASQSHGQSIDLGNRIIDSVIDVANIVGGEPYTTKFGDTRYRFKIKQNKVNLVLVPAPGKKNKAKTSLDKQPAQKSAKKKAYVNVNKTIKHTKRS